jgi:hypothetical protein
MNEVSSNPRHARAAPAVCSCCVGSYIQRAALAALRGTGRPLQELSWHETEGDVPLTYRVSAGHADVEGLVVHAQRLLSDVIQRS